MHMHWDRAGGVPGLLNLYFTHYQYIANILVFVHQSIGAWPTGVPLLTGYSRCIGISSVAVSPQRDPSTPNTSTAREVLDWYKSTLPISTPRQPLWLLKIVVDDGVQWRWSWSHDYKMNFSGILGNIYGEEPKIRSDLLINKAGGD